MDEDEKGRLELELLKRKLSWSTELREWLQALTTLAAFAGLAWAIVTNVFQIQNTRMEGEFEKLNHTLTQMGGERRSERASGASQLGFLTNDDAVASVVRDRALIAAVDALTVEEDPVVRDLLTERIQNLRVELFRPSVIESVERQLLSRNRQLAGYLSDEEFHKFILWRLNTNAYHYEPTHQALEVETTGQALALLIARAPYLADLSGLVCIGCFFRDKSLRLDFSGAIFVNTQFTGWNGPLDLRGSDFSRSTHFKTVFDNVNLEKVSFRGGDSEMERLIVKSFVGASNYQLLEMTFRNANSDEADFTGRPRRTVSITGTEHTFAYPTQKK